MYWGFTLLELPVWTSLLSGALCSVLLNRYIFFVCKEKSAIITPKIFGGTVQNSGAWYLFLSQGGGDFRTCNHKCNDYISNVGCAYRTRDSLGRIVSRWRAGKPRYRVSIPRRDHKVFFETSRPDRSSPSLLFDAYQGLCSRGWSGRIVKLTSNPNPVPKLRMSGPVSAGTTLPFIFISSRTWFQFGQLRRSIPAGTLAVGIVLSRF